MHYELTGDGVEDADLVGDGEPVAGEQGVSKEPSAVTTTSRPLRNSGALTVGLGSQIGSGPRGGSWPQTMVFPL